jgi:hypothetical protein
MSSKNTLRTTINTVRLLRVVDSSIKTDIFFFVLMISLQMFFFISVAI